MQLSLLSTVSSSMNLLEMGFGRDRLDIGPPDAGACSELLASSNASASSKFFVVLRAAVAVYHAIVSPHKLYAKKSFKYLNCEAHVRELREFGVTRRGARALRRRRRNGLLEGTVHHGFDLLVILAAEELAKEALLLFRLLHCRLLGIGGCRGRLLTVDEDLRAFLARPDGPLRRSKCRDDCCA